MLKLRDQPVDVLIGPIIEQIAVGQLWERGLHCGSLFDGTLLDTMAVIRLEGGESLLEGLDIEERDGKGTDATAGAAEPTGNFAQQSGGCPLEPVLGFLIQRKRVDSCHGHSFHSGGEIDDEFAIG